MVCGAALIGLLIYAIAFASVIVGDPCPTFGSTPAGTVTSNKSCTDLGITASGVANTIMWSDSRNSCLTYDVEVVRLESQTINIFYNGLITCGPYNGKSVITAIVIPSLSLLDCATSEGVSEIKGVGVGLIGLNPIIINSTFVFTPGINNTVKPTQISVGLTISIPVIPLFC